MTDIQQARDVLEKHRKSATPGDWRAWLRNDADADLIMLTAGSPALLDAIDEALYLYRRIPEGSIPTFIKHIAAAILSADERMSA